ncbi:MAG: biotin carboxylase [Acidimicrobiaceae bacterium]|nr:biotin carboxylase [Acidimicrobiaceae bacterium]MCY3893142.1 biotin carboxylase [Acidimicrobiaceae bacterium]MDE0319018.1 biotin carboxylase [Acidimicrobiaceae bacterium]
MSDEAAPEPEMPPLLAKAMAAREATLDEARPEAVARQHARGRWTARERIAALFDPDTFVEYGQLAQPQIRSLGDGPADGLVMGVGQVDGVSVCAFTYDYTVMGGSQSPTNHRKVDRLMEVAERNRWPVIFWSEGAGARATELFYESGTATTFIQLARLSGLVPIVTILSGPSFAGQANIAGTSDVVIATRDSTMGLSGPPLVRSATGEDLTPEELGPMSLHERTGAVDLVVDDETAALQTARRYLSYFTDVAAPPPPVAHDQTPLRTMVPENPRRAYDVRKIVEILADEDSVMELRPLFGRCLSTSLCRIEGHRIGVLANNPMFGAGAIDSEGSAKFSRFVELCNAYDLPLLFLCDTPGFMIGTAAEKSAIVRHSARTLVAISAADVPILGVILRKAYGLGYYAMGSDALDPDLYVGWPTAEFGGMGLEGAVNIVYRDELEAAPDDATQREIRDRRVAEWKERNTGLEFARSFLLDDIIDPAETRDLIARLLATFPAPARREGRKHPIDPW